MQNTRALRGLLALLIILGHYAMAYPQLPFISSFGRIGGPVVGCFFFLSGYGLAISYKHKGRSYIDSFLAKRFGRLLPAFVIMTLAAWIVKQFMLGVPLKEILIGFAKGYPVLDASWYVYTLLLFYLIFYLLARTLKGEKSIAAALLIATLIYMVLIRGIGFGGWWYSSILSIPAGFYVALYRQKIEDMLKSRLFAVVALTLAGIWVAWILAGWRRELFQPTLTLAIPLSIYLIITLASSIPKLTLLNRLGTLSYEIYLCQGFFMAFLPRVSAPVGACLMFIGSIAMATLLHSLSNANIIVKN